MFDIIAQTYANIHGIENSKVFNKITEVAYKFLINSEIAPEWGQKLVIDMISDSFKDSAANFKNSDLINTLSKINRNSEIEDVFFFASDNTIFIHDNKMCWIMHEKVDNEIMPSFGLYNLKKLIVGSVFDNEDFKNRISVFDGVEEILTFSANNLIRVVYTQKNGYTNILE